MNKSKIWFTCLDDPYKVSEVGFINGKNPRAFSIDDEAYNALLRSGDVVVSKLKPGILFQRIKRENVGDTPMLRDSEIFENPIHPVYVDRYEFMHGYIPELNRSEIEPLVEQMHAEQKGHAQHLKLPSRGTWTYVFYAGKSIKPHRMSNIKSLMCDAETGLKPELNANLCDPKNQTFVLIVSGTYLTLQKKKFRQTFMNITDVLKAHNYYKRIDIWDAGVLANIFGEFSNVTKAVAQLWSSQPPF